MKKVTLFLSCVSDEFHKEDKAADPQFCSWRTHLEHHLNGLERAEFVIITQESALQNEQGDLLEVLERVVERSDYVVHLYGELPGESPSERSLRRLRERCPDFLHHEPEILKALPEWHLISYTHWELYFAFHHQRSHPLIYFVEDDVPRSPASRDRRGAPESFASRHRHMQVIRATGQLRLRLRNRDHLALSVQTYLLKQGAFEPEGWVRSTAAMLTSARANLSLLLPRIAHRLGVGRGPSSGVARPVKPVQFLEAVEAVAEEAGVRAAEFVSILEEDLERRWNQALEKPRFAELHELALTWLALGDLPHALLAARQAADHALRRMNEASKPEVREKQRENALNALLLLHDIARLDHDIAAAINALAEGGPLMDYQADTVAWADYHMLLAEYAHDKGYHEAALRWLWGLEGESEAQDRPGILDAYEEAFGRTHEAEETDERLAKALLLLAEACHQHGEGVKALPFVRRARRIYERARASGLYYVSRCWLVEARALESLGQALQALEAAAEAETILSTLHEQHPQHPIISKSWSFALDSIGLSHAALGAHEKALAFMTRSLEIIEVLSAQEPSNATYRMEVGITLDSIGRSHAELGAHEKALEFQTRSLEISEALAAQEPGNAIYRMAVGIALHHIGRSHAALGAHEMALAFMTRSLEIREALAAQEPGNATYRREVGTALQCIGLSHAVLGANEKALEFLIRSLEISEALAAQEPGHFEYQRDLYLGNVWTGRVLRQLGQAEEAKRRLHLARDIADSLAQTSYRNTKMPKEQEEIQTELSLLES